MPTEPEPLIFRLKKRAEIRRQISTRKSVQEGKPDRIADLLEEAAAEIERLGIVNDCLNCSVEDLEERIKSAEGSLYIYCEKHGHEQVEPCPDCQKEE